MLCEQCCQHHSHATDLCYPFLLYTFIKASQILQFVIYTPGTGSALRSPFTQLWHADVQAENVFPSPPAHMALHNAQPERIHSEDGELHYYQDKQSHGFVRERLTKCSALVLSCLRQHCNDSRERKKSLKQLSQFPSQKADPAQCWAPPELILPLTVTQMILINRTHTGCSSWNPNCPRSVLSTNISTSFWCHVLPVPMLWMPIAYHTEGAVS